MFLQLQAFGSLWLSACSFLRLSLSDCQVNFVNATANAKKNSVSLQVSPSVWGWQR